MSYPDGHVDRFVQARKIVNEACEDPVTGLVSLQLEGKVVMTIEAYEAMAAKFDKLLDSNDKLARHISGFSTMFEQNKRALMAHGWDQGFATGKSRAMRHMSDEPNLSLEVENPFRKEPGL